MRYFLFFREHQIGAISPIIKVEKNKLEIQKFRIGEKGKLYIYNEIKSIKTTLSRLIFFIITLGKSYIYYCVDDKGNIIHTSYVIPKCIKFPFLSNNDYEIGPCMTANEYRGKGIYPQVLNYITYSCGGGTLNFIYLQILLINHL